MCVPSRDAEGFLRASEHGYSGVSGFWESAGRSLAPPKNDGIIWKQSRSHSRSDEYLPAGGVLMPSVLSQLAHMVPRYQECVFSQRMPAVYLYWSVHLLFERAALDKPDLLLVWDFIYIFDVFIYFIFTALTLQGSFRFLIPAPPSWQAPMASDFSRTDWGSRTNQLRFSRDGKRAEFWRADFKSCWSAAMWLAWM